MNRRPPVDLSAWSFWLAVAGFWLAAVAGLTWSLLVLTGRAG